MTPSLADDPVPTKNQLRSQLRAAREALSPELWRAQSDRIVLSMQQFIAPLALTTVAVYAPLTSRREVDVEPLDPWLRQRGIRVAYPLLTPTVRGFAWVDDVRELHPSAGLFRQPASSAKQAEPGQLDLIVVPMLGFTERCHRIGYGAGFYDQMLERFRPPAIAVGVAFEAQKQRTLPLQAHDQPCDAVITEATTHTRLAP